MSEALSANLRALLGDEGFILLTEAFGGTRLYVPSRLGPDHQISKAIGLDKANLLSFRYAHDTLRIPLARELRAQHYRFTGLSNAQIASKLGIHETSVNKIFARLDYVPQKNLQLKLDF